VLGCGLLLNGENEVSIFFTGNGLLMGKQLLTPYLYSRIAHHQTSIFEYLE
jgi:hypothetical protein